MEMLNKLYCLIHSFLFSGSDVSDMNLAKYLITNGVTIPVRCKDCKHYDKTPLNNGDRCMCTKFLGLTIPRPDDFCSYGERRTDERKTD